jgi:hypothetical protein
MATKNKKPSIYFDRGTIGSSDELDEYGVWVKSEPKELSIKRSGSPAPEELADEFAGDLPDLEIPDVSDEAVSDEIEDGGGFGEEPADDEIDFTSAGGEIPVDESFNESFNESFDESFDESFNEESFNTEEETGENESLTPEDDTFEDGGLEFPDIEIEEDSEPPGLEADDFAEQSDEDDEPAAGAVDESADLGFTEISFDDLTAVMDEHTTAEELPESELLAGLSEDSSQTETEPVFEEPAPPVPPVPSVLVPSAKEEQKEEQKTAEKDTRDLSTQLLMKIADELASIRTELSSLKKDFAGIKTAGDQGQGQSQDHGFFAEEDDEKIALTGDELNNILQTEGAQGAAETESGAGTAAVDEGGEKETQGGGFFDEDEDETISLTGDELDNILNTANFTEEAGETESLDDLFVQEDTVNTPSGEAESGTDGEGLFQEGESEELGLSSEELSLDNIADDLNLDINFEENDLDELGGEIGLETSAETLPGQENEFPDLSLDSESIEAAGDAADISFEAVDIDVPVEAVKAEEDEEIQQLREEGVLPMTPAPEPEDANFLEEDPMAASGFEEESLDLSGAVIDEPDLSADIMDNPVEEPSLEAISIDLEMDNMEFADGIKDDGGERAADEPEFTEEEISLELSEETLELPAEMESSDSAGNLTENFNNKDFNKNFNEDLNKDLNEDFNEDFIESSFEQEPLEDISIDLPPLEEPAEEQLIGENIEETEAEVSAGESLDLPPIESFGETIDLSGGETAVEEPAIEEAAVEFDIPMIEDEEEEENPVSPESAAEIEDDLTLIPEGFVVESGESGGVEETDDDEPAGDDFLSSIDGESGEAKGETAIAGETEEASGEADDTPGPGGIPSRFKNELKTVLSYMDQLLESLPDEKIEEFARSEYFDTYKKLFKELGLV